MNNDIEGKVVVITGASSGLGEVAARYLSSLGLPPTNQKAGSSNLFGRT